MFPIETDSQTLESHNFETKTAEDDLTMQRESLDFGIHNSDMASLEMKFQGNWEFRF